MEARFRRSNDSCWLGTHRPRNPRWSHSRTRTLRIHGPSPPVVRRIHIRRVERENNCRCRSPAYMFPAPRLALHLARRLAEHRCPHPSCLRSRREPHLALAPRWRRCQRRVFPRPAKDRPASYPRQKPRCRSSGSTRPNQRIQPDRNQCSR